jgi:hypothetical protein
MGCNKMLALVLLRIKLQIASGKKLKIQCSIAFGKWQNRIALCPIK